MIWKPPAQKTSLKSLKESGNMILAIFGAVALVGTIGAGTSIIVNGPMKVMSQVNRTAQTESQIMLASKMVMLDVPNVTGSGDCDGDNLSEPREWRDAAGAGPDGVTDSNGGGFLPMQIGTTKRDSWGTQYGYCVWDHGALIDDAGCGGGTQKRLQGFNSIDHPVIAVISAGPNGAFETPCRDFDNADNDSNAVLDYSAGDDPLISPTGDDIVVVYSYAEAAEDNLGIWELAVDPTTNEAIARTNKDVEFTGSSTSFGGTLTLDGVKGLDIPDDASLIVCDATVEGQMRRNMSNDPPTLEICEDTGGSVYAWGSLATSSPITSSSIADAIADPVFNPNEANCTKNKGGPLEEAGSITIGSSNAWQHIFNDGKYIYASDSTGLNVFSFDGTNFTLLDSDITYGANGEGIWGDGTYIYYADRDSGTLVAYTFDGKTLTEVGSITGLTSISEIWGDGTYLYAGTRAGTFLLHALYFNGTSFTLLDTTNAYNNVWQITGDSKYIYLSTNAGPRIYEFNGTSFNYITTFTCGSRNYGAFAQQNVVFWACGSASNYGVVNPGTLKAFSFDGNTSTEIASIESSGYTLWGDGAYLYVGRKNVTDGVQVLKFTGSSFIETDTVPVATFSANKMAGDGTYFYAYGGNTIKAYSGYTCTKAYVPDVKENYISQITVEQTGSSSDTLGSAGWAQVLASDTNGDETGIAFVVDQNASKGSAPTAAITAMREADPSAAGIAFKTKASDGTMNNRNYLGHSGYFGFDVTAGTTANLFSTLQIGDHSTTWHADFQKGLLVTSNDGSDQIGYFGFYNDTTDTNTVMFSKALKIKGSNVTGNNLKEYIRFEQTQATTFFGNIEVKSEAQTAAIQNKSYSATDINDGELNFKRKRLDGAGADTIVQDGDIIGQIKFQGFNGTSVYTDGPTITAKVNGVPAAGNIPTELSFKTKQTNFDPETANCGSNNGGPFVLKDTYSTTNNSLGVWGDGTYIYTAHGNSGVTALTLNNNNLTAINTYDTTGSAENIWGDGTYIYIADMASGIHALTFDGSSFSLEGTYNTTGNAKSIWGDGTYIYVADDASGIHAFTFDGSNFTLKNTYNTSGFAYSVWGDGNYIYVGDHASGIHAFTFDGSNFTLKNTYNTSGFAVAIWGDGNYIYVGDHASGIHAFTFDGSNFTLKNTYDTTGWVDGVWGDGNYIYVGDRSAGIHTFTFDGSNFTLKNTYDTTGSSWQVWGDGTTIYVADDTSGLHAFSGFECYSEIKIAANDNVGFQKPDPQSKLHVGGRILADEGILIDNDTTCAASDEGTMRYVSGLDEPLEVCNGSAWIKISAAVPAAKTSVDCSPIPFELRNITDGTASTEYTSNGFIVGGLDSGEECYLALSSDDSNAKINLNGADETSKIVPVQNGDVVKVKATTGTGDDCKTCHLSLGVQQASFQVGTGVGCKNGAPFDPEAANCVANNGGPFVQEAVFNTGLGSMYNTWGDGNYIYISAASSGIYAYTFDGSSFTLKSNYNTPGSTFNTWGDGNYIYVADGTSGIHALSFDGSSFTLKDTYNTPDQARSVWGDGNYIYVADGTSGVRAYTFDGSTLTEVGNYDTSGYAYDAWGDGNYIYVADGTSGIHALSFDGSSFTLEDTYNTPGQTVSIWGDGNYIYIADFTNGIRVYTFDGSTFVEIDSDNTTGLINNIWGDGTYIYIGDSSDGTIAYSFNGSTLTQESIIAGGSGGIWGDGTYIYSNSGILNLYAYSGFECTLAQ